MYAVFRSTLNFLLGSLTYMIGHLQQTLGFLVFCWFSGEQYTVICLSDHWLLLSWSESAQQSEILTLLCSSTKVLSAPLPPKHTHISIFFVFLARVFGRLISSFKFPSEFQCTLWFCLFPSGQKGSDTAYTSLPLLSGDCGEQTLRHRYSITIPQSFTHVYHPQ